MSDKQPYEQHLNEQWDNLPLPDENLCWEDMRRRLEEDDDEPVIVWWRKGCALWAMLLLLLTGVGFWLWHTYKDPKNENISESYSSDKQRGQQTEIKPADKTSEVLRTSTHDTATKIPVLPEPGKKIGSNSAITQISEATKTGISGKNKKDSVDSLKQLNKQARILRESSILKKPESKNTTGNIPPPTIDSKDVDINNSSDEKQPIADDTVNRKELAAPLVQRDSIVEKKIKEEAPRKRKISDSSVVKKNSSRTDSAEANAFFFAGGMGMYQQLPVAGQTFTPYNSLGRKGSLADYIPSVYLSYHKKNKWFLQAEFRYGAPQYTKPVEFVRDTKVDTFSQSAFITSLNAKKTFYHQLPLSFNYNITKNWTVGTGVVWNKFKSAVVESQSRFRNLVNQSDSLVSNSIEPVPDSARRNFSSSYFQALLQTQYKWKRLTIGARYTIGLQPYIRYRIDGGQEQKQRTSTVQLFLNFQLWKSREKIRN